MSLECSECESDARTGHAESCSRHPSNRARTLEESQRALAEVKQNRDYWAAACEEARELRDANAAVVLPLDEQIKQLQSQLAEARAEVEDLSRKNSTFVDEIVTLKAEVERVRKTWAANWQEQKDQVEELRALMADMVRAFEILEPDEIVNSAVLNRMKAALAKGDAE